MNVLEGEYNQEIITKIFLEDPLLKFVLDLYSRRLLSQLQFMERINRILDMATDRAMTWSKP